ncbi:MAG: HNH endonuclease signature motif containing protein [Planctomycetota bacterium]
MREVAPGDLVFSFADTRIGAFGVAHSYAYEAPKPLEFGSAGRNWEAIGWRVDVEYHEVAAGFRPLDWIERLRPLLPPRYSPLQANGHGVQSVYLTEIPQSLALVLAELLGNEVLAVARADVERRVESLAHTPEVVLWERHLEQEIARDTTIPETDRLQLVMARRGQGVFRTRVAGRETRCRVTGVERPEHLRASHCKPWRDCNNDERLDGNNGLMLTPSIDHLFDRGFVSFEDDGRLLVSPVAHRESLRRMGVTVDRPIQVGAFTREQGRFLEFHRDAVLLRAAVAK